MEATLARLAGHDGRAASAKIPPRRFVIEVTRSAGADPEAERLLRAARTSGLTGLERLEARRLFFLEATLDPPRAAALLAELVAEPVVERARLLPEGPAPIDADAYVDVTLHPGVFDPVASTLLEVAGRVGVPLTKVATGRRYLLWGTLSPESLKALATKILSNPVIEHAYVNRAAPPPFVLAANQGAENRTVALRSLDENALLALSQHRRLALDLAEMEAIQAYFEGEGRDPSELELETIAQTWSEHCAHKTFRARIDYDGPPPGPNPWAPPQHQTIDGLLRTYIKAVNARLAKPWVRSAIEDNAGIVALDDELDLAFKVETHNHPSALEPFGGANTGVGGVIRDVLGVSARPIANTDILFFGPLETEPSAVPAGSLHPRRIFEGVVHGIEDYGNKMGIPTVAGGIFFHPGYLANPLVYAGCLGILPHGSHPTQPSPGDLIVLVGGKTGRDGLGGATFSSMEMDAETGEVAGSAVQIGHPIEEKQVMDFVIAARDRRLYHAITDCGAGGLSSAVGEMARGIGATVELERVPLKYPGLAPWEIWLSEAQERMVLAVPPELWPELEALAGRFGVEASAIGRFEATGRLRIRHRGQIVGDLDLDFLFSGMPRKVMRARWRPPPKGGRRQPPEVEPERALLGLLAHPNIQSREDVIRRYDHEVQGGTVGKPLVGAADHGPADAAVIIPRERQRQGGPGVALAVGLAPTYGELDPYRMAWAAVDEAVRNLVAVGADPERVALLDNFSWGNPLLEDRLGALVRATQGAYAAALAFEAPYISGKDSLNNEYLGADGKRHAIPGTLVISAISVLEDPQKCLGLDLKAPGNGLYLLGLTRAELGGSHLAWWLGQEGPESGEPPAPEPKGPRWMRALYRAIREGLIASAHDLSEGGLGVALAEMAIAGRLGARVDLAKVPREGDLSDLELLFSESLSRFLLEVAPEHQHAVQTLMEGVPLARIGEVTADGLLTVLGQSGDAIVRLSVSALEAAWRGEVKRTPPATKTTYPAPPVKTRKPRALILHARGTNRDHDALLAAELAGAEAEIVSVRDLERGEKRLLAYDFLILPGGFTYGDDLGAGTVWALDLATRLRQDLDRFVREGRPVLGICNGFQALVKAGILPGFAGERSVTLTANASGKFETRWTVLLPNSNSPSLFVQGLPGPIAAPVAHGEGRFMAKTRDVRERIEREGLVALRYSGSAYPENPNGSELDLAGLTNPAGNVLGLMPHPENHAFPWQHPRFRRGEHGGSGLWLFIAGVRRA